MTQRKSIGAKLFIALIALTLISCCFLGSTFARYTSGGKGSASTGVAKWSIDVTGAALKVPWMLISLTNFLRRWITLPAKALDRKGLTQREKYLSPLLIMKVMSLQKLP